MFTKFDFLHMTYVETEVSSHLYHVENIFTCTHVCCFVKNRFCCDLRCFVVKSILSRFTHFCVEKIEPKIVCVEKNDKYQVPRYALR